MKRVKIRPVLMSLPEATEGDDFDLEVEDSLYDLMHKAVQVLRQISGACNQSTMIAGAPVSPTGPSGWTTEDKAQSLLTGKAPPPVSQVDPVIDTTVRDSEMRPREREMSLEEFLEPPERTRSAPRPRAHSWRHGNG